MNDDTYNYLPISCFWEGWIYPEGEDEYLWEDPTYGLCVITLFGPMPLPAAQRYGSNCTYWCNIMKIWEELSK